MNTAHKHIAATKNRGLFVSHHGRVTYEVCACGAARFV